MNPSTTPEHAPSGLTVLAALGVLLTAVAAYFFLVYVPSYRCQGELCGLGLVSPSVLLGGSAVLLSALAVVWAVRAALVRHDRLVAASLGLLLASATFSGYALLQYGHPGHPLVTLVYGFPPDYFGLHPVASACSIAFIAALGPAALGYSLTTAAEKLRQVGATAVALGVLAVWVAIRLFG